MVDRADDDVAAGCESGDDDQESEVPHAPTIAGAERRDTTQEREGAKTLIFAQPEHVSFVAPACRAAAAPVDFAMESSRLSAASPAAPAPPPDGLAAIACDIADGIRDARLQRLHAYWTERKGDRRMPARRDIDPLDFPYLLGNIMLLDDMPDGAYRDYALERCRGLVEAGEPAIVHHDRVLDGRRRCYEALWLPFAHDGSAVAMLLCALVYENRRERPRNTAMV